EGVPEVLTTESSGAQVRGYPALVASGNEVSLRILSDPIAQARQHEAGVRTLLARSLALPTQRVTSRWNTAQTLAIAGSPDSTEGVVQGRHVAAVASIRARGGAAERKEQGLLPFTRVRRVEEFEAWRSFLRDRIEDEVFALATSVAAALTELRQTQTL